MNNNPLTGILPTKARKFLYAVLFVAALVYSIYQASDGDWGTFVGSLLTSLLGLLAASNVRHTPPAE